MTSDSSRPPHGAVRVIYNDDFRSIISIDQPHFGFPASTAEFRGLVERVRGTGVTSYVMDSIEYDNKVYFKTERGIDWATIDFTSFGDNEAWQGYAMAGRLMQQMRDAGDEPLDVVIRSCRDMGIEPIAGVRMNDCHGLEPLEHDSPDVRFYLKEHPEFAFCFPGTDQKTRLADYSHKALRDYRFGIIEELMEKFDFDGLELNWVRQSFLFQPDDIIGPYGMINAERFAEQAPIVTDWTVEIRRLLDSLARKKGKKRMCLGVRVPETPEITRAVGIDLPAWIREAELDYIVPSGFHSTNFNIPVEKFMALCKGTDCAVIPSLFPNVSHSPRCIRAYQDEIYAAAAQNYYGAGAGGVQVFNHFNPTFKKFGVPFNANVLNVIASPEAVAACPTHHYYIAFSAKPADVPDIVTFGTTGHRGTVLPPFIRQTFEFRFADDLAAGRRQLTRLRFKIFDMAPGDGAAVVSLNNVPLECSAAWRQRTAYRTNAMGKAKDNWLSATDYADLELLAGEPIVESEAPEILALIAKPPRSRPDLLRDGAGYGRDVFMLVEADVSKIPVTALHKGLNRLYVRVDDRRDDAAQQLYMGELEIVTSLA